MEAINSLEVAKGCEMALLEKGLLAAARVDAQTTILYRTDKWSCPEDAISHFRKSIDLNRPRANVLERKPMRRKR